MSNKNTPASRRKIRNRRLNKSGTVLPILLGPQLITTPCRDAVPEDFPQIQNMIATLLAEETGVGLAAPQIGCDARMFIMRDKAIAAPVVFINPKIVSHSIEMVTEQEGCLSEPDKFVDVVRHLAIWVEWSDLEGKQHDKAFFGFSARIIQHEMDHLNGFCQVLKYGENDEA